ncbi:hypothetical protein D3C71_1907950 [compost metagenome]
MSVIDRWIALVGVVVVIVVGWLYMVIAKPHRNSTAPEGDAIEMANMMRKNASNRKTAQVTSTDPNSSELVRGRKSVASKA